MRRLYRISNTRASPYASFRRGLIRSDEHGRTGASRHVREARRGSIDEPPEEYRLPPIRSCLKGAPESGAESIAKPPGGTCFPDTIVMMEGVRQFRRGIDRDAPWRNLLRPDTFASLGAESIDQPPGDPVFLRALTRRIAMN